LSALALQVENEGSPGEAKEACRLLAFRPVTKERLAKRKRLSALALQAGNEGPPGKAEEALALSLPGVAMDTRIAPRSTRNLNSAGTVVRTNTITMTRTLAH
jgi:hypothetical protein